MALFLFSNIEVKNYLSDFILFNFNNDNNDSNKWLSMGGTICSTDIIEEKII